MHMSHKQKTQQW